MASSTRFYLINKKNNWQECGFSSNVSFINDSITLIPKDENEPLKKAIYISKAIDSMTNGTKWHRITFDSEIPVDTLISFHYFATDNNIIEFNGNKISLDDLITDDSIHYDRKINILDRLWKGRIENPKDILLHSIRGRYVYFMIELYTYTGNKPIINSIKIEFPMDTFIRYLPDVFEKSVNKSEFLMKYMAIFQNLYLEIEDKIDNISDLFDPDMVDNERIRWLADFLNIDNHHIWDDKKLRKLLKNIGSLYELRGTKEGIEKIVELYTGEKPIIIEAFEIDKYYVVDNDVLLNLYSSNPYTFTVLVKEKYINTEQDYSNVEKIIESFKPAHTLSRLISLKQTGIVDGYSYIGINSSLYQNKYLRLDGRSAIPYDSILTDKDTN